MPLTSAGVSTSPIARPLHGDRAVLGVGQRDPVPEVLQLRVGEALAGVLHGVGRDTRRRWRRRWPRRACGRQSTARRPRRARRVGRAGRRPGVRRGRAGRARRRAPPVGVVAAGDRDPGIVTGARVHAVRRHHRVGVALARHLATVDGLVEHGGGQEVHARLGLGEVEVLALARSAAVIEGGEHGAQCEARRRIVAVGAERTARRPVRPTREVEEAAERRPHRAEAGIALQRPGLAEQAARHHHEARPKVGQALVVEVEGRPPTWRERLDDDVGPAHEIVEDVAPEGLAQVETDAALAGRHVEQQPRGVVARRVLDERTDGAGHVEVVAGLDAHDRRTEVGHHPGRRRPGHRPGQVEDVEPVQRRPPLAGRSPSVRDAPVPGAAAPRRCARRAWALGRGGSVRRSTSAPTARAR